MGIISLLGSSGGQPTWTVLCCFRLKGFFCLGILRYANEGRAGGRMVERSSTGLTKASGSIGLCGNAAAWTDAKPRGSRGELLLLPHFLLAWSGSIPRKVRGISRKGERVRYLREKYSIPTWPMLLQTFDILDFVNKTRPARGDLPNRASFSD